MTQGPIWYFVTKENNPPTTPILNGETEGNAGTTYTYYTGSATDPNNDNISYLFDWGDGSPTDWLGPYTSGETVETNHVWDRRGDYTIKVKAKDEYNAESP